MTSFDSFSFRRTRAEKEVGQLSNCWTLIPTLLSATRTHPSLFQETQAGRRASSAVSFNTINPDRIAFEFDVFGDHKADLAVGDSRRHQYCFIEFEDAAETSVLKKASKVTPEWSPRSDHGTNQIIDWIYWLDNQRARPRTYPGSARYRFNSWAAGHRPRPIPQVSPA